MTDDELVERLAAGLYQCHGHSTLVRDGSGSDWVCDGDSHSPDCPVTEKPAAMALAREVAAAVRAEAEREVIARVRRCPLCAGCGLHNVHDPGGGESHNEPCPECEEFGANGFIVLPDGAESCQECGGRGYAMFRFDENCEGVFDRCECCCGRGFILSARASGGGEKEKHDG